MLRTCNRTNAQLRKNDYLDILTLLDKCNYILKDDKIILRYEVKEQSNQKVIDLLNRYKKKGSDLQELQLELRKLLNEIKGGKKPNLPSDESNNLIKRARSKDKISIKENNTRRVPPFEETYAIEYLYQTKQIRSLLIRNQSPKQKLADTNRTVTLANSELLFSKGKRSVPNDSGSNSKHQPSVNEQIEEPKPSEDKAAQHSPQQEAE